MAGADQSSRRPDADRASLVVVRVEEAIDCALAGRQRLGYQSPPQEPEEAMALVAVLLGRPADPEEGRDQWVVPIAGGRRVITVTEQKRTSSGQTPRRSARDRRSRTNRR